ncbi:MAG: hypothetical protein K1X29_00590 [Bdellovibrionales bacterium]|nr:hypothetical protein [Bdellovibrionales bacterium]
MNLDKILSRTEEFRTPQWEQDFLASFPDSMVTIENEIPQPGPDGWPYLMVKSGAHATEPVYKILHWLSERGVGLVVNVHKPVPDYVFNYGMIWNWKETGQFITPSKTVTTGAVHIESGKKIHFGEPNPSYLPPGVRKIMAEFLRDQGVRDPKILVLSHEEGLYDLCFSLESLGSPPSLEHKGIAEALGWFLPQHYSLMLISEKGLPHFYSL